jgi:hypothetical protein
LIGANRARRRRADGKPFMMALFCLGEPHGVA